jgi:AbrB family looped-hinge helix DNA binding protein
VRIGSKGQVTIPQDIRERAGLLPNTDVEFEYVRGNVILKPLGRPRSKSWKAVEKSRGTMNNPMFKGWTTEKIMQFLRGGD